ncbi:uncharacterized protein FOMMEDRAFT_148664, partial [Fomitiporia mediterranea MF3/22]|uniref:uncharacterized protein n=1 Tax=Fomitiporia mediterranea (strain MF3/22) TaxID=694068 RepID=UPI00044099FE
MTGSSGLEHPPAGQRRTVSEYLPKDVLLDVTYAYTVLYRFRSTDAKEMLKKYAEDRYPVDIAKERRIRRLRRDKEQPEKDQRQIAFWDWVDVMQMKIHGIRPEDIQGEEERRKREADELDAQRIARWQKGVDESYCGEHDVNDGRSEMDEGEVILHAYARDDEDPLYSLKPRKWLLYVSTHICGIDGRLRLLNSGEDLTGEEMEEDVIPGDHYVFCFDGEANFLDWYLRGSRNDRKSSTSTRSRVIPEDLKEFYGGCPFTQEPPDQCDVCHLIPFAKGDDYLHRLLASRGDPNNTMTINDYQNQIVTDVRLHRAFDRKNNAFLKTPNRFLKTSEVPGGENDPPDIYCVTIHCLLESEKRRANLHHGARSHMKEGSGLEHPPTGRRRTVAEYLPKDILLDITYAYAVLYRFCSTSAKEMLEKTAEKKHYPDGIIKRGEDREGNAEKEELKRKRKAESEKRSERNAHRSRTGDDNRDRANEDEREFDFWDWVLAMQMKIHGVRPEDIKAEEERREKEMVEL